jgi:hypothetical protein
MQLAEAANHTPSRRAGANAAQLHVEVTHRFLAPNRCWELRPATGLAVEELRVQFDSWERASQAGKFALEQFRRGRKATSRG